MTQNLLRFEGREVRMIDKEGEPWWVAKDVCDVLGLTNSRKSMDALDEDERGVTISDTLGGKQELSTVNEAGLYSLILRSRKPEAKRFKRWVTHDVLPSIRRKGIYMADEGDMAIVQKFSSLENRLARIESSVAEAEKIGRDLPEPLGVLPEMTNVQAITKVARVICQMTGVKPGALWSMVYTDIEFRWKIRLTVRKKKAGWRGTVLTYAIHEGHGDKIYDVLCDLLKRYTLPRAA